MILILYVIFLTELSHAQNKLFELTALLEKLKQSGANGHQREQDNLMEVKTSMLWVPRREIDNKKPSLC